MIEQQVRRRVLRWCSRHGLRDPDDARDMLAWRHGGLSLDATGRRGSDPDQYLSAEAKEQHHMYRSPGSDTWICRVAAYDPSTRRSARGVRERAVTDPERMLVLCPRGSAVERAADTRRGHESQILSPQFPPGIPDEQLTEIRAATNGGLAVGTERFQREVVTMLGHRDLARPAR